MASKLTRTISQSELKEIDICSALTASISRSLSRFYLFTAEYLPRFTLLRLQHIRGGICYYESCLTNFVKFLGIKFELPKNGPKNSRG